METGLLEKQEPETWFIFWTCYLSPGKTFISLCLTFSYFCKSF